MSQQYVIFQNEPGLESGDDAYLEIVISTLDHKQIADLVLNGNIRDHIQLTSAGTVSFRKGNFTGVEADVTHGSILLGIPVNLDRMALDKKCIEEKFTI